MNAKGKMLYIVLVVLVLAIITIETEALKAKMMQKHQKCTINIVFMSE